VRVSTRKGGDAARVWVLFGAWELELSALTNDSSKAARCEVFPAVQLNLGHWERLLECRHLDCCSIPLGSLLVQLQLQWHGSRGALNLLIACFVNDGLDTEYGEREIPKPGDSPIE
jgi:hypothetical protein